MSADSGVRKMPVTNEVLLDMIQQFRKELKDELTALRTDMVTGLVSVSDKIAHVNGSVRGDELEIARLQGRVSTCEGNWDKFWKYGLGVVLAMFIGAVATFVLKGTGVI